MSCTELACCNTNPFAYAVTPRSVKYRVWVEADPTNGGTVAWTAAASVRQNSSEAIVPVGSPVTVSATVNPHVVNLAVGADIIICIDESGSMGNLTDWQTMVTNLNADLVAAGVGASTVPNRYGLIGFGTGATSHSTVPGYPADPVNYAGEAHRHHVGGAQWGTAAQAVIAIGLFDQSTSGCVGAFGHEDVYAALDKAIDGYTWRTDVAKIIIFITDEDRNANVFTAGGSFAGQFAAIKAKIVAAGINVIGVTGQQFLSGSDPALGINAAGHAWLPDGSGGITETDTGTPNGRPANAVPLVCDAVNRCGRTLTGVGDATHVTDAAATWVVNAYAGKEILMLTGAPTSVLQTATILSNTATELTLDGAGFSVLPAVGDKYQICEPTATSDYYLPTDSRDEYTDLCLDVDVNGSCFYCIPLILEQWPTGTPDANVADSMVAAIVDDITDKVLAQVSWIFAGWYEDGVLVSSSASYTFTPTDDTTLVAHFDSITD